MTDWKKIPDLDTNHTALTMYEKDGFRVWKGKRRIYSVIYSANKWHLERLSDHMVLYSAETAKRCRTTYDNAVKSGVKVKSIDVIGDYVNYRAEWNEEMRRSIVK